MQAILPHPYTPADQAAGYRDDLSIVQAELSLTQMLDQPVSGRIFFEQVIRDDLDIGRPDHVGLIFDRRVHLPALRKVGFTANRRLLRTQRLSHDPADGAAALAAITDPIITGTGQRIPGMRFTDPRVQALLTALCVFRLLPRGFTNRDLRDHLTPLLGALP